MHIEIPPFEGMFTVKPTCGLKPTKQIPGRGHKVKDACKEFDNEDDGDRKYRQYHPSFG